jgi:hypothetical protein
MKCSLAADTAHSQVPTSSTSLTCYPAYLNSMVEGQCYRLDTYALPLRDGTFPGLSMERQFIKRLCVDGVELVELQRANGSRHVIAIAGVERVTPLGRATLEADTLRQSLPEPLAQGFATLKSPAPVFSL